MSIEKKCETCSLDGRCLYQSIETNCIEGHYIPKEELVREDERNKIITKLEEIKKIVDDNGKSYIISANLLMIIEMIKEREYDSR